MKILTILASLATLAPLALGAAQNLKVAATGEASETDTERVVLSPYVHGDSTPARRMRRPMGA